ncbi:uncharacterized protein MYCFIDRAFT_195142 [Pseudocercospora fijiensis CIRAD86]|uniref:ZZ-type domain-containing protein n=1 Tax=Pseudocercospora fijiensis (strain CIRAD86) TaxID=383855 RepID=M2Z2A0_PSEFD|nr:uncharacterized protein MYCFIDRAFT_195142 [Pseudocercospora fijiensis CIRAD86]EME83955.1 hypothetical protein MYCFIDRAFT_195142 [Pseudocercospora fijiensis CIRAD86]
MSGGPKSGGGSTYVGNSLDGSSKGHFGDNYTYIHGDRKRRPPPIINGDKCSAKDIATTLHYHCAKCEDGTYNICIQCYRNGRGCHNWRDFRNARKRELQEREEQYQLKAVQMESTSKPRPPKVGSPHTLSARKYIQTTEDDCVAGSEGWQLQDGAFCESCLDFCGESYWNCKTCFGGGWGFCDRCVQKGRHCSHELFPIQQEKYCEKPKEAPYAKQSPHLASDRYILLPTWHYCDTCQNEILPGESRLHCYECSDGHFDMLAIGVYCGNTWRSLSFQGTHLHERMSLLTLIILGEGAIGIAKSCQYVTFSEGTFSFTGSVAGEIFCAVINLHFLYMLYFDWIQEEEFGIIRQQLCSVLHFPLHVALVLAVEGAAQCITWNAAIRRGNVLVHQVEHWVPILNHTAGGNPTATDWKNAAIDLNTTANTLFDIALERSSGTLSILQTLAYSGQSQIAAVPAILNGTNAPETAGNAFWWLTGVLYQTTFKIAGFYPPETTDEINQTVTYLGDSLDFTKFDEGYWMDQACCAE